MATRREFIHFLRLERPLRWLDQSYRTRTGTFRTFLLAAEVISVGAGLARTLTGI